MPGVAATDSANRCRRLVINADDLGISEGVNRGIVHAIQRGVVTSASMLVNMPGFDDAVVRLAAARIRRGVGVHLNLVAGRPLTSAPTLTDPRTGEFHGLPQLALRAALGKISVSDLEAECVAQIQTLRDALGWVTHLDSHRHAHALPGVAPTVLRVARAEQIGLVRVPLEAPRVKSSGWCAGMKIVALHASWRAATQRGTGAAMAAGVDHFFGVSLQGGRRFARRLDALLAALPPGTSELMVHPGYSDAPLAAIDGYTWQREREIDALTAPALRESIEDQRIQLVGFESLAD